MFFPAVKARIQNYESDSQLAIVISDIFVRPAFDRVLPLEQNTKSWCQQNALCAFPHRCIKIDR